MSTLRKPRPRPAARIMTRGDVPGKLFVGTGGIRFHTKYRALRVAVAWSDITSWSVEDETVRRISGGAVLALGPLGLLCRRNAKDATVVFETASGTFAFVLREMRAVAADMWLTTNANAVTEKSEES